MAGIHDMKLVPMDDEDLAFKIDTGKEKAASEEVKGPKYPYCLRLCLNDDVLEKLGIKDIPSLGSKLKIEAVAFVAGSRMDDYMGKQMDIQITGMSLTPEQQKKEAKDVLYNSVKTMEE